MHVLHQKHNKNFLLVFHHYELLFLHKLKYLYLRDNQVDNLKPLGKLEHLVMLDIGGNKITDLIPLMNLSKLKHLSVDDSPYLPQEEIDKLQRALPECEISYKAAEQP